MLDFQLLRILSLWKKGWISKEEKERGGEEEEEGGSGGKGLGVREKEEEEEEEQKEEQQQRNIGKGVRAKLCKSSRSRFVFVLASRRKSRLHQTIK